MADHEPTMGEVYRLIVSLQQDVREMRKDLIGRAEYESDQEGIAHKFQQAAATIGELKADLSAVSTKSSTELKEVRATLADQEREQRQNRAKWIFALVMAGATPILGIVVNILIRGGA